MRRPAQQDALYQIIVQSNVDCHGAPWRLVQAEAPAKGAITLKIAGLREESMSFIRSLLLSCALVAAVPVTASAQTSPTKSITLLVPAAAGGPTDTVARLVAESMGRTL